MAGQDQFASLRMPSARPAGVKSGTSLVPTFTGPAQGGQWARQVPGNGSHDKKRFSTLDRSWVHVSYVLIDILLISFSGVLAFWLRFVPSPIWHALRTGGSGLATGIPVKPYGGFLLLYAILIVLGCQGQDLYRTRRGRSVAQESWGVVRAVTFATLVLSAFIFCSNLTIVSRGMVGVSVVLNTVTLVTWRIWKRHLVTARVSQGIGAVNALIVEADELGLSLANYLEENKQLGYRVVGFLDSNPGADPRILGRVEDLAKIARALFVDDIFITMPSEPNIVKNIATEARRQRLNVKVVPELYDDLAWNSPIQYYGHFPVMELHWERIPAVGLFVKRATDMVVSTIALFVLSPVFAFLAIAIRLDSPGSVFFTSKRVGKKGRVFSFYKFRTMVSNAEDLKKQLHDLNERDNGLLFKIAKDPRVTRIGKVLRRYSVDELPQLWNVLRGDMSLVGPRPPLPEEVDKYSLEHLRRLDVKPGITGLWQVSARKDPSFESYMTLDLEYIEKWSFWLDAKVLLKTLPAVLSGSGA
jgi:exopolysaccharide biosynthesis polyprenyl glycosylphosphotransferase